MAKKNIAPVVALTTIASLWGIVGLVTLVMSTLDARTPGNHAPNIFGVITALVFILLLAPFVFWVGLLALKLYRGQGKWRRAAIVTVLVSLIANVAILALESMRASVLLEAGAHCLLLAVTLGLLIWRR